MSMVALPTSSVAAPRRFPILLITVALLILAGGSYLAFTRIHLGGTTSVVSGNYQPAVVMDLDVRLTKDGELQSVNNIDVVNKVEGLNTIQELVKEGTFVHKGDVLVTLDSSNIQKNYDQSMLDLQAAESALAAAKETKEIQETTNTALLQEAVLGLQVAQLDLKEYTEGVSPAAEDDARTKLRMAELTVQNKEQDLLITRNLFAKGFVTAVDVKKSELDLLTVQNELAKAKTDLKVLTQYTRAKDLATKQSAVAQAESKVGQTKKENNHNLNKLIADLDSKQETLLLRKQLSSKLKDQLEHCTIKAPADGLVVYASTSSRSGDDQIKEGSTVRLQQVICRLPDTSSMKAVIRVQEGQVSKLRVDDNNPMRATVNIVGFKKSIGASLSHISVLADSSQRWWNPDLKEYPVDLVLDETPPDSKPGLSAQVEILIDRKRQVVAIPLTSIYTQGTQSFAFVRKGTEEPRPVEIKIGATNDTHAEIVSGVAAGDDVLLLQPGQGRMLVEKAEKAGLVKLNPAVRPGDSNKPKKRTANTKLGNVGTAAVPKA
jgi:HlyD family secretion protein